MAKLLTVDINVTELDTFERVAKDRLDFGFDSIYFRYAELCDELAMYKVMYEHELPCNAKKAMNGRKMHFYNCLEQLLRCHEDNKNDINK